MAGKKMKKMPKMAKMDDPCCYDGDCGDGRHRLEVWMMLLLGLIGFLSALGFINFGIFFQYVWSLLLLAMGMSKLLGIKL